MAATAKAPITSPVRRTRRTTPVTPAPRSTARPRMTSGEARSVERMANPAVVSTITAFSRAPTPDGWVKG